MKPTETELPGYTRKQEFWNSLSHAFGVAFALVAGPFLLAKASATGDAWRIVSSALFVASLLILYAVSATYHGMRPSKAKRVLRVLDHDMVFVLITGTYAPYCLVGLMGSSPLWAWIIYGLCLALGVVGIVLNSCDLSKFKVFSMIDYILMGWLIVISIYPLSQEIGFWPGVFLLLLGGIAYTIGAVIYGLAGKKNHWLHLVFHLFVLAGTALMFFSVYFYVI
jgi:hemolysin III